MTDSLKLVPVDFDPFARPSLACTAPSTEAQREIWAIAAADDRASCVFNEPLKFEFRGELDVDALKKAIHHILKRHDALRGCFSPDGTTLCIEEFAPVSIPIHDFSGHMIYKRKAFLQLGSVRPYFSPKRIAFFVNLGML